MTKGDHCWLKWHDKGESRSHLEPAQSGVMWKVERPRPTGVSLGSTYERIIAGIANLLVIKGSDGTANLCDDFSGRS